MARKIAALALVVTALSTAGGSAVSSTLPEPCPAGESWASTGVDEFVGPFVLLRSQGVNYADGGWVFSWQGGLERTDDRYLTRALATWPYDNFKGAYVKADGTNRIGGTHIGDVDTTNGLIYAPIEDGSEDLGIVTINDPEFQQSHIALYDAKTLLYTGTSYAVPPDLQRDGVPWIAIDHSMGEAYTGEWNMPRDELNVFDLQMGFQRVLPLRYPDSFGPDFHLSRIQGGEVFGGALYAARDDEQQTIFKIDLTTGDVTRLFSLNGADPSELEGLAIHPTADGSLLHVLLITDNDFDDPLNFARVRAQFHHYALSCD